MNICTSFRLICVLVGALSGLAPAAASASDLRIGDLCRVKGQEENTLQGLGLVVGLRGTGDGELRPTTRALARMMQHLGGNVAQDASGLPVVEELKNAKNVALVFVTATIPAAGARQGDALHCQVNAISAKSLAGGTLLLTPLLGPRPGHPRVYALAQGALSLPDSTQPAGAVIANGCRLEESFHNEFVKDGEVTLVLQKEHARFGVAQEVAELINRHHDFRDGGFDAASEDIAVARDQVNIVVRVPEKYRQHPVQFVSQALDLRMFNLPHPARVVIRERAGTVVIGADVVIAPVAVTHRGMTIESGPFQPLEPNLAPSPTKLKELVNALNAIKASNQDVIEIIKSLKANGALYGELVIE